MSSIQVPFLDMVALHKDLEEDFVKVFRTAVQTGRFIGGPDVEGFEREFADYCGTKYCVGVNSGTDALRFALMADGIGAGTIAITVPNTFIATVEAISQAGAQVAFVDIDPATSNMSITALTAYLHNECRHDSTTNATLHLKSGCKVAAIVPVHLYGQTADMDAIRKLATEYNLKIYEDACQAHGADYYSAVHKKWERAGTMGRAAAFSFYPGKNLGALGEGGAVTTDDANLAAKIKTLREHGSVKKYYHTIEGYNGRLDAIQAGFLRVKLPHLEKWNDQRKKSAAYYTKNLSDVKQVICPKVPEWAKQNFHLYVIQADKRDDLMHFLEEKGVGVGLHYPLPLHLQDAYAHMNIAKGSFPVSEKASLTLLSLPMYPGLREDQQAYVVATVKEFFAQK